MLRDLKSAREREKQTYSVVPYNGKRGESRRDLSGVGQEQILSGPVDESLLQLQLQALDG